MLSFGRDRTCRHLKALQKGEGSKHEKIHFAPCGLRIQRFSILANQEAQTAKKSDFITCKKKIKFTKGDKWAWSSVHTFIACALMCSTQTKQNIVAYPRKTHSSSAQSLLERTPAPQKNSDETHTSKKQSKERRRNGLRGVSTACLILGMLSVSGPLN